MNEKQKWILLGAFGVTTVALLILYRKKVMGTIGFISSFVNKLKNKAIEEWNFWANGTIKEGDPKTIQRLRDYWKEGAGVMNWNDQKMTDEAWSAAFISYIMKKSGAGSDWKYSPSHSTYITDSIKNRKENNSKKFKGYKPEEVKVEVGDLVAYARQSGVGYDTTGAYKSHADVVVGIKNGIAETIGGNVGNSVTMTKVPLTPDGKIDLKQAPKYFVVIKNKK